MWWNRKKKTIIEEKKNVNIEEPKIVEPKIDIEVRDIKVRVEPFDMENEYYIILYSYDGVVWKKLVHNVLFNNINLCDDKFPVLIKDFEQAVNRALSLSKEKIENDIILNKQKFDSHVAEIREKIEKRNKTFHN
jgi:hypothetical protein